MEWININKSLPHSDNFDADNNYYLIWIEGFGFSKAMFIQGMWYESYTAQVYAKVTHWMEIEYPID